MHDAHESDESLCLPAVAAGSTEALARLYRDHAEAVFRVAFRITRSRSDAEDVLHDVFLGLPRALRAYREEGRFAAWLRRIAVRTALMRLRAHRRRREEPLEATDTPAAPAAPEARLAMEALLRQMPESLRVVLVLKEIEGYSHAEIAELLGISPGASAVRLVRAWSLLREKAGGR